MSSDSDEDYMSDKLLVPVRDEDVRPGLLFNRGQKRKHELMKKQEQEREEQRSKTTRTMKEAAVREEGMKTAIAPDNKGFQMLAKMGYQPGSSLGKSQEGIKEPIPVEVRGDKRGVGKKDPVTEIVEWQKRKRQELQQKTEEFREVTHERNVMWSIKKDFLKAQGICEELDFRQNIKMPLEIFFWTRETMKKILKPDDDDDVNDESSDEEDALNYDINEDNLFNILEYLRERYFYCLYCAFTADNSEDLAQNCPGLRRVDHDDI